MHKGDPAYLMRQGPRFHSRSFCLGLFEKDGFGRSSLLGRGPPGDSWGHWDKIAPHVPETNSQSSECVGPEILGTVCGWDKGLVGTKSGSLGQPRPSPHHCALLVVGVDPDDEGQPPVAPQRSIAVIENSFFEADEILGPLVSNARWGRRRRSVDEFRKRLRPDLPTEIRKLGFLRFAPKWAARTNHHSTGFEVPSHPTTIPKIGANAPQMIRPSAGSMPDEYSRLWFVRSVSHPSPS